MGESLHIREVTGRMVMDLKAGPAVEAEVALENGARARAFVPLRKEKDAKEELAAIRDWYSELILYEDAARQDNIDALLSKDMNKKFQNGSGNTGRLAVSMAVIRAAGAGIGLPLYRYMGGSSAPKIPVPVIRVFGGETLKTGVDVREIMIVLQGNIMYSEKLRLGNEIYHNVIKIMGEKQSGINGTIQAVGLSGCKLGKDVQLALRANTDWLYVKGEGVAKIINMEQAGTVSEAFAQVEEAKKAGQKVMIEGDSHEIEEDFTSDFAAAVGAEYIKIGVPCRDEWSAKNNELLRLEEVYRDKNVKTGCIS